ncbi:hypothetical protein [Algivirga pacifica]|uniref:Lipoprotein n=1 Tax=Algivirga pacifica TaxID=1162670 RepID=A0ABP9DKS6_9BACT
MRTISRTLSGYLLLLIFSCTETKKEHTEYAIRTTHKAYPNKSNADRIKRNSPKLIFFEHNFEKDLVAYAYNQNQVFEEEILETRAVLGLANHLQVPDTAKYAYISINNGPVVFIDLDSNTNFIGVRYYKDSLLNIHVYEKVRFYY